jgi:dGTPase
VYGQLLYDVKNGKKDSPIFRYHIQPLAKTNSGYEKTEPNQLVVDYIASMTDDYFIEMHALLFPTSPLTLQYHGYFGER